MRFGTVSRAAGLLFGLSLLALASSCGGGGGGDSTGRASGVEGVPDGAAFINQDGLKFSPSGLSVAAGETVYFKNSETAVHSVTIDGKNESGTMKHDTVFQWTSPDAGTYKITCDFHPQMKATITVQ